MKHVVISPPFASSGANQRATKKIDQVLFNNMRTVFPGFKETSDAAVSEKTLLIEPVVKEMKFVGGFARAMVGCMAGSSAVLTNLPEIRWTHAAYLVSGA